MMKAFTGEYLFSLIIGKIGSLVSWGVLRANLQRKGGVSSNVFVRENNFQACELGKHQSVVSVTFCLP